MRQRVGGLDDAREAPGTPQGEALADARVQLLGRVRQGHAQHGLVVDAVEVQQRPLNAPKEPLVEGLRIGPCLR